MTESFVTRKAHITTVQHPPDQIAGYGRMHEGSGSPMGGEALRSDPGPRMDLPKSVMVIQRTTMLGNSRYTVLGVVRRNECGVGSGPVPCVSFSRTSDTFGQAGAHRRSS